MNIDQNMHKNTLCSIVLPVYNESATIQQALLGLIRQKSKNDGQILSSDLYEIIVIDNNSTDDTKRKVQQFVAEHVVTNIIVQAETQQGVAWARKAGMDLAVKRSKERDALHQAQTSFFIFSADADCVVDAFWLEAQLQTFQKTNPALTVCRYDYPMTHFATRPRLAKVMNVILHARTQIMPLLGGFPDGKGFGVTRDAYEKVGGIDIFYQLAQGEFVCHLSDDWDFGIKVRASGEAIQYCSDAIVMTNPRRIDHALKEMVQGVAYGVNGTITMQNIRQNKATVAEDLNIEEASLLYDYSIKDFTVKHIILPLLLTPTFLEQPAVQAFLTVSLCARLKKRIAEITHEMRLKDFTPIHAYKTPCFRLYFEFKDELFMQMREKLGPEIGEAPLLPNVLAAVLHTKPQAFRDYVYYYCEDREAGEAHNYFGNGGVF